MSGTERPFEDDFDGEFDEVDAVRRFPSEEEWLDLPFPELAPDKMASAEGAAENGPTERDSDSFVDRVLRARRDELELDAQLAEVDATLPDDVLAHFEAPTPSADFVDRTMVRVEAEQRQRWQTMLARYVAPEPSPDFVARTLQALAVDADERDAAGSAPPLLPHGASLDAGPAAQSRAGRLLPFLLAAAAIMLMLTQYVTDDRHDPLELRLARNAPTGAAYADATTPLAAVFAQVAAEDEPYAMFDAPVDGLWLASAVEAGR